MKSTAERLFDVTTRHQVNMERFKLSEVKRTLLVYRRIQDKMIAELAKFDPVSATAARRKIRSEAALKSADGIIEQGYSEIKKKNGLAMQEAIQFESEFTINSINGAVKAQIATVALSGSQIKAMVSDVMFQGAGVDVWWDRQARKLKEDFGDRIRAGLARGDGLETIMQTIRGTRAKAFTDGIMARNGKQAETLVRTALQSTLNAARTETLQQNQDIMDGFTWLATLDMRTCEICGVRDGKNYDFDYEPEGHDYPWLDGPGAIHPNCRCTSLPRLKPFKGIPQELQDQIDATGERPAMDGSSVPGGTDYETWLSGLSVADQDDILGPKKADLFRAGSLSLSDVMTGDGQPKTLKELSKEYPDLLKKLED